MTVPQMEKLAQYRRIVSDLSYLFKEFKKSGCTETARNRECGAKTSHRDDLYCRLGDTQPRAWYDSPARSVSINYVGKLGVRYGADLEPGRT